MYDSYNREITYLRISVTDKCNLRCRYCMPEEGVPVRRHEEFLSFEEITAVVRAAVKLGVTKVRLTGGEPLVKRGIVDLVRMVRSVEGLRHLAMTTNGTLLARFAGELKAAGLDSVNVSLDTLDPERYRHLTRGGRSSGSCGVSKRPCGKRFLQRSTWSCWTIHRNRKSMSCGIFALRED